MGDKYLYRKVYQALGKQIADGTLPLGAKLPSEAELSAVYQVSSITVKRALSMLQEDGLVKRIQGRGTFVQGIDAAPAQAPAQSPNAKPIVGLILEHVTSAFGLDMLYEMTRLLDDAGYQLLVRFSFFSIEKETQQIDELIALGVSGLLIMPCHNSYYSMTILRLILEGFPVVLIDKRMNGLPVSTVCTDGFAATRKLVHHLKECGCRTVAALSVNPTSSSSLNDRMRGFRQGAEETGLICVGECVVPWQTGHILTTAPEEDYLIAIRKFLQEQSMDGIVCTEYGLARALYTVARQMNITLGCDLRACCLDEDALATEGFFFTHMRQDELTIACKAVELMLALIGGEKIPSHDVRVPAIFHHGKTT